MMPEGDPALAHSIGELKLVKNLELTNGLLLRGRASSECAGTLVRIRYVKGPGRTGRRFADLGPGHRQKEEIAKNDGGGKRKTHSGQ